MEVARRTWLLTVASLLTAGTAAAFGNVEAFQVRAMRVGNSPPWPRERLTGASRWATELLRRTNAPARLEPAIVDINANDLWSQPFLVWAGAGAAPVLTRAERGRLRRFLSLGGLLVVDDFDPRDGRFSASAAKQLGELLPESPLAPLDNKHVLRKSFYLLGEPVARDGSRHPVRVMRLGRELGVVVFQHDLLGALANEGGQAWTFPMNPNDREQLVRWAVNLTLYLLCSDYKDDQVHAEWLMRRRGTASP